MLLKQWRAGERQKKGGGKRLATVLLAVREWRFMRRQCRLLLRKLAEHLLILFLFHAVLDFIHALKELVAHVQAELAQFALFDKLTVLSLAFSSCSANAIATSNFVGGHLVGDELWCWCWLGLGLLGCCRLRCGWLLLVKNDET